MPEKNRTALDAAAEIAASLSRSQYFGVNEMAKMPAYFNAIFKATLAAKRQEDQLSEDAAGK